jgi:hypothetical protein
VLDHVVTKHTAECFWHPVDCWFAEVFGEHWEKKCFAYYRGEEEPLRKLISTKKIQQIEKYLLFVLLLADALCATKTKMSWKNFRLMFQMAKMLPSL